MRNWRESRQQRRSVDRTRHTRSTQVEVIVLAQQQSADWVLIDDKDARKAARQVGIRIKGTAGLLLAAFRQSHLSLQELELLIQSIKAQPNLWISDSLCDRVLAQARQEAQ